MLIFPAVWGLEQQERIEIQVAKRLTNQYVETICRKGKIDRNLEEIYKGQLANMNSIGSSRLTCYRRIYIPTSEADNPQIFEYEIPDADLYKAYDENNQISLCYQDILRLTVCSKLGTPLYECTGFVIG